MMYERAFMEGALDPFDWILAEQMHRTVVELNETMTEQEYQSWRAFHVYRRAMEEKALRQAEKVGRGR
jgi:hypothetical protein